MVLFWFVTIANLSGLAIFFMDGFEIQNGRQGIWIDNVLYPENRYERKEFQSYKFQVRFCEKGYDFIYIDKKGDKPEFSLCDIAQRDAELPEKLEKPLAKFKERCRKKEIPKSGTEDVCDQMELQDASSNGTQLEKYKNVIRSKLNKEIKVHPTKAYLV
uniref:Uncharacterized protein n=1 Tax=Candidatus Kentrum sp. TUN TaxID=2126343 RepID=A0A451B1U1_9GAMM|nr:MAG: hypothetical protein BECKTUN1418F_GA0071002_13652 [Candidatus Kentron sp. TUN]VFK72250.1 MAG: hypothetical protein BECKTUN1418E_GA0071001_13761 [Candidatus Kentron sp. TUN]